MKLSELVKFSEMDDGFRAHMDVKDSKRKVYIFADGDTKRLAAENLIGFLTDLDLLKKEKPEPEPPKPSLKLVK